MPSADLEYSVPNLPEAGIRGDGQARSGQIARWLRFVVRIPAMLAILMVQLYRLAISPFLPPSCRFQPTCSQYMVDALRTHGFWRGLFLGTRRVFRCHPGNPGGFDPVPEKRG